MKICVKPATPGGVVYRDGDLVHDPETTMLYILVTKKPSGLWGALRLPGPGVGHAIYTTLGEKYFEHFQGSVTISN